MESQMINIALAFNVNELETSVEKACGIFGKNTGNNHIVLYLHETSELSNHQSITFCESTSSITPDQVNFQNHCILKSEVKNKQHKRTKSHVLASCKNKREGLWVFQLC